MAPSLSTTTPAPCAAPTGRSSPKGILTRSVASGPIKPRNRTPRNSMAMAIGMETTGASPTKMDMLSSFFASPGVIFPRMMPATMHSPTHRVRYRSNTLFILRSPYRCASLPICVSCSAQYVFDHLNRYGISSFSETCTGLPGRLR